MKLFTKFAFLMFVLFSLTVSIASIKTTLKSKLKTGQPGVVLNPMPTFVPDKSSIWNAADTVDLMIKISAVATSVSTGAGAPSEVDFRNVQSACLGNLKNLGDKWANNMKYFWNACYEFVKNGDPAVVDKETILQEAFNMVNQQSITAPVMSGRLCGEAFIMKVDKDKVKGVITDFFKKFNFKNGAGQKVITSFIGAHRNMAPAGFFKKLNGDK